MISCRHLFQYSRFVFKDGETPPAAGEASDADAFENIAISALQDIVRKNLFPDWLSHRKGTSLGERKDVEGERNTFSYPLNINGKQVGFFVEKYMRQFKQFTFQFRSDLHNNVDSLDLLKGCGSSTEDLLQAIHILKTKQEKLNAAEDWKLRFKKNKRVILVRNYKPRLVHYDEHNELSSEDCFLFKGDREEVGKIVVHFKKGIGNIDRVELLGRNENPVSVKGKTPSADDLEKLTDEDLDKALALPEPRF